MIAATCGLEIGKTIEYMPLLNQAIELSASKPRHVVVKQRDMCKVEVQKPRDVDWDEAMSTAPAVSCVPVDSNHPLYILYTSGSTGKPKGVLRDSAPHAVALNWSIPNFF